VTVDSVTAERALASQWNTELVRESVDNDSISPHDTHQHKIAPGLLKSPSPSAGSSSNTPVAVLIDPPKLLNGRNCIVCGDAVTRKTRMHCRACGHSVCESCSAGKVPLPQFKGLGEEPQRVCEFCVEAILEEKRGEEWARGAAEAEARAEEVKQREQEKQEAAFFGMLGTEDADGMAGGQGKQEAEADGLEAQRAMQSAIADKRNSAYTQREMEAAEAQVDKEAEEEEVDLWDQSAAQAATMLLKDREDKAAAKKKKSSSSKKKSSSSNRPSDKALKKHDGSSGVVYPTSSSTLVDGGTGRTVCFDEILFSNATSSSGLSSGSKAETGRLKLKRSKLAEEAKRADQEYKKEKIKARKVVLQEKLDAANAALAEAEKQLANALAAKDAADEAASQAAAGRGGTPQKQKKQQEEQQQATGLSLSGGLRWDPLPRPWERGISLAVLEKFATEVSLGVFYFCFCPLCSRHLFGFPVLPMFTPHPPPLSLNLVLHPLLPTTSLHRSYPKKRSWWKVQAPMMWWRPFAPRSAEPRTCPAPRSMAF
jgi:hypothetical protein